MLNVSDNAPKERRITIDENGEKVGGGSFLETVDANENESTQDKEPKAPKVEPVKVTFKKRENPIEIEIDLDALTWGDNLKFSQLSDKLDKGEIDESEGMEALNALISKVVGRDVSELPARVVSAVIAEVASLGEVETENRKN